MKILITGGCGFLGSNLAAYGIKKGYDVSVFDNLSRLGSAENLKWLESIGKFNYIHGDIRNSNDVAKVVEKIRPDALFHLAGQVAMTTSIENPRKDFEINALGSFNVLDSVSKYAPSAHVIYSSTNKVYGDLEQYPYDETASRFKCVDFPNGFDEAVPLEFHSPYGCSKGAADQYMQDFSRIFGVKTTVFRHSSMYGGRQFSTYDQGWIGWFCKCASEIKKRGGAGEIEISGTGKQVRDVLHADDMISLYYSTVACGEEVRGQAFNIGGGMENSLSLLELFSLLEEILKIKINVIKKEARQSDQRVFVADISKAKKIIKWEPLVGFKDGVQRMIEWVG